MIVSFLLVGCMFVSVVLNCMNFGRHSEFCFEAPPRALCAVRAAAGSEPAASSQRGPQLISLSSNRVGRVGIGVTFVLPCDWAAHAVDSEPPAWPSWRRQGRNRAHSLVLLELLQQKLHEFINVMCFTVFLVCFCSMAITGIEEWLFL